MFEAAHGRVLAQMASELLAAVFADWGQMTGFSASVHAAEAQVPLGAQQLLERLSQGGVLVSTHVRGRSQGTLGIHFPRSLVRESIAAMLMKPDGGEADVGPLLLSADELEAFHELSNLLCGACNNQFRRWELDMTVSQAVADLRLLQLRDHGADLARKLAQAHVGGVRLAIAAGGSEQDVHVLLPAGLARGMVDSYLRRRDAA